MKLILQKSVRPVFFWAATLLALLLLNNFAIAQSSVNLVRNGSFANGLTGWSPFIADFAGVGANVAVTNGEVAITSITGAGGEIWHVQLNQILTKGQVDSIVVGATYEITFEARSPLNGRQLRMFFGEDGGNFTVVKIHDIQLTTDKKTYATKFIVPVKFPNMKLGFEMGLNNASVFIDNVSLKETEAAGLKLPVTFDDPKIEYVFADFGGNVSEIIADPTNASNKVVRTIKTSGAELWAGTTVGGADGFSSRIPFASGKTTMSVRVWSPDANIPVRLKVESLTDPTISVETEATVKVAQVWETLVFDFSKQVASTAAINFDYSYGKASIFFNFGKTGGESGEKTYFWDDVKFVDGTSTSISDSDNNLPEGYMLGQNYPNPFNPTTSIEFALPESGQVQIDVYNMIGRHVMTVVNGSFRAGNHVVYIDASLLSSGLYVYRMKTGNVVLAKKMTLVK